MLPSHSLECGPWSQLGFPIPPQRGVGMQLFQLDEPPVIGKANAKDDKTLIIGIEIKLTVQHFPLTGGNDGP